MSIDWCDVKCGTWAEIGGNVSCFTIPNPGRAPSGFGPREINTNRDIEFKFAVPIDVRAITIDFLVNEIRSLFLREVGIRIYIWHPRSSGDSPVVEPNLIFASSSMKRHRFSLLNDGYQVSEEMRRKGFHMDPCYPRKGADMFLISSENQASCKNVEKLKITLTRIPPNTRVRFNKIVILGQPSSLAFTDDHFRIHTERILRYLPEVPRSPTKRFPMCHGPANHSRGLRMIEATTRRSKFTIPSEFLDPFTDELMEFPMRLPGGKCCDKAYLYKYLRVERKWRRKPNDPFTGKPFTLSEYPILNQELKLKIDKWCLMSMLGHIPRWYPNQ